MSEAEALTIFNCSIPKKSDYSPTPMTALSHYLKGETLVIGYSDSQAAALAQECGLQSITCLTPWDGHLDQQRGTHPRVSGDICRETPFDASSFDTVIMSSILVRLPHPARAFQEIYRILKSGGYFFSTFGPIWSGPNGHSLYLNPGSRMLDFTLNGLPSHFHLLFSEEEIAEFFLINGPLHSDRPDLHIDKVLDFIYRSDMVNRFFFDDYELLYKTYFRPVFKKYFSSHLPTKLLAILTDKYPSRQHFEVESAEFLVHKE